MIVPLAEAGGYVAAAYGVFVLMLLIYIGIMAVKLVNTQRSLRDIIEQISERREQL
ncbi:MAG: hypothetical protein WAO61_02465 [Solirubrobacterales bacterium]